MNPHPRLNPPWNQETARNAAARSAAVKKARKLELEAFRNGDHQVLADPSIQSFLSPALNRTRHYVRRVLDNLGNAIANQDAEIALVWTNTLAKLAETERVWSGRPMPGTLKPKTEARLIEAQVTPLDWSESSPAPQAPAIAPESPETHSNASKESISP